MIALFFLVLSSAVIAVSIEDTCSFPDAWVGLYGMSAVITVSGTVGYSEGVNEYIGAFTLLFAAIAYTTKTMHPFIYVVLIVSHTAVTLAHMVSDGRYGDTYVCAAWKAAAGAVAIYRYRSNRIAPAKDV